MNEGFTLTFLPSALFLATLFLTHESAAVGRIAISADGNCHDPDDKCSTPMALAILAKTGNASRLVFYEYNDHFWLSYPTWESDMKVSARNTAAMWGGFNPGIFHDGKKQTAQTVNILTSEINKSTASNRLTILAAGPEETIGMAVVVSNPSARQYVTMISHGLFNDYHATDPSSSGAKAEGLTGATYNYDMIGAMGIKLVHIHDQNANLSCPYSQFTWLRDSPDPNLQWLWARGQVAAKPTFDCSDAGMTYYLIFGDENATPAKLKALLTKP
jgi:hypothetical protein